MSYDSLIPMLLEIMWIFPIFSCFSFPPSTFVQFFNFCSVQKYWTGSLNCYNSTVQFVTNYWQFSSVQLYRTVVTVRFCFLCEPNHEQSTVISERMWASVFFIWCVWLWFLVVRVIHVQHFSNLHSCCWALIPFLLL
jgi:hypothetical protein